MPLQPSDVPALRAKHLDLVQARYFQINKVRNLWHALSVGILMITGTLTLFIAVLIYPSSLAVALTILFIAGVEWIFIEYVKRRDFLNYSMILQAAHTFGHSSAAGFDVVPDFTSLFINWHASGPVEGHWHRDGAPDFFRKLFWGVVIKTITAFMCLPLNTFRIGFGS